MKEKNQDSSGAEALLMKAEVTCKICNLIVKQSLSQKEVAGILGLTQHEVSRLLRGYLNEYSLEKLVIFVELLAENDLEASKTA